MDPRILIASLLLPLGLAAAEPPPPPAPSAVATDSVRDPAGRGAAVSDARASWIVPPREGSPGGAHREAFRTGDPSASWARPFEFDGMYEVWTRWPSLPVEERAERLSWTGPSLAGVSDAAPAQVASVATDLESGFGGEPVRRLGTFPSPVDTPRTRLQFHRGALASYRFGLGFSRILAGPWGLDLRMGTRSAQARAWTYRDQVQDLFQGSFGRTREELPAQGRSPGQDDVQWETVLSRATGGSLFEFGWTWIDLRRGIPDPRQSWMDSGYGPLAGREARSGVFGRILSQAGAFRTSVSGRWIGHDWTRAAWSGGDSGAPQRAAGATDHQELEGEVSWEGSSMRWGATARTALRTGNTTRSAWTFQEDQERIGAYAALEVAAMEIRGEVGWDRLNDPWNRTTTGIDGNLSWERIGESWTADIRLSRELRMPDWEETILPDPLLRSLPSPNLGTESRWTLESRHRWKAGRRFAFDAALAGLSIDEAIQPRSIPVEGSVGSGVASSNRSGLVLGNAAGRILGWSGQGGLRMDLAGWWAGTQWAWGRTMAPGEGPGGRRDLRYPEWHSRTTLGWEGTLLEGRAEALSSMSLRTWSSAYEIAGATRGTVVRRSSPGGQLDWENQLRIKTFALFWRLENLLDDRQSPAAGWTPPGIRSGWGVTWSFGG